MPAPAYVTLVGVALTVAVLAIYLTRVAIILNHVNFTVGTVNAGVRAIAQGAEPLDPLISEIYSHLETTRLALADVLGAE